MPPPQALPQLPQWVAVVRSASQPLLGLPSQLAQPRVHVGAHARLPAVPPQLVVPCELATLQEPHAAVVLSCVSQPGEAVQFPQSASQAPIVQVPVEHEAEAWRNEHATPQSPQSVTVRMLRSQPSFGFWLQLLYPVLQLGRHAPAVQAVVPFAFEQLTLQAPHAAVVPSSVSQSPPATQSPQPASQPVNVHVPVAHDSAPWANEQAAPQSPQSSKGGADGRTFVSQPLSGLPSQLLYPVLHTGLQPPAVHAFVPLTALQASPRPRQFDTVPSVVSQPA